MSTIKDAITAIATEAGYEGDKPQTIADAIEAYGTVAGGGGGSGPLVIEFQADGSGATDAVTCDYTFNELVSLSESNILVAHYDASNGYGGAITWMPLALVNKSSNLQFCTIHSGMFVVITVTSGNTANYKTYRVQFSS